MLGFWLLLFLLVLLIVALPWWPYSSEWDYWPAGIIFALLIVWLLAIWFGWMAFAWPWTTATPVAPPA